MTGTGSDCLFHAAAVLLLLLGTFPAVDAASTLSTTSAIPAISTCQSRTVNYITHTLPQQCLKTGWAGASILDESGINSEPNPLPVSEAARRNFSLSLHPTSQGEVTVAATTTTVLSVNATTTSIESPPATPPQPTTTTNTVEDIDRETEALLDEANFLSFEEWKKQNLERAGQSGENIGERRQVPKEHRRRPGGIDNVLDSLGEDSEIELDFKGFGSGGSGTTETNLWTTTRSANAHVAGTNAPENEDGVRGAIRSRPKDAGKTCAERINYASFDCAATVLKTNPEGKGSSSILVENKDSYMLNKCAANNKFFTVELCNDILVDTVVLANFEFFSSMFRSFRVSASDRYPTTADRWKELGIFEARNSREVQAFPVQNPLIWARYLRVEFLTHYGNEFYCPVSLLRVHGTTMMEEYRREEESALEVVPEAESTTQSFAAAESATTEIQNSASGAVQEPSDEKSDEQPRAASSKAGKTEGGITTGSIDGGDTSSCDQQLIAELETLFSLFNISGPPECKPDDSSQEGQTGTSHAQADARPEPSHEDAPTVSASAAVQVTPSSAKDPAPAPVQPTQVSKSSNTTKDAGPPNVSETPTKVSNHTLQDARHHQVSTAGPPPANPTTQEGFFKTIHKRLQLLEANATLSLQYIEEQSRILRDAFVKVEKRQLARTTNFLENLNATVLNELRGFRQMYDLLWQSTVIELETQREQSQREIVAISARLSILADEVIFQKRMSIVQSLLLFLCLGLVLFSRYPATASYLELPLLQSMLARSQTTLSSPYESPPESPRSASFRPSSARRNGHGPHFSHSRHPSDESTNSLRSPSPEFSPPTPSSGTTYSGDCGGTGSRRCRRRADSSPPSIGPECSKGLQETPQSSPYIPGWTRDPSGKTDPITWPAPRCRKENEGLLSPDRTPERKGEGTERKPSKLKCQEIRDEERFDDQGEEIDRDRQDDTREDDGQYDDTQIEDEFMQTRIGNEDTPKHSATRQSRLLPPSLEESSPL
ncbi:hypothetical protein FGG08_005828 [Glutinoglossum americanum]|uniref:SUN domain-containing protein n=1 Tax=Glutinoglossum americanum TaxID=1670608 RepID=A0A9P8I4S6_9PEZI|nr:hypothetical protein FGG08_005828 [Glutinoglossum americanum]